MATIPQILPRRWPGTTWSIEDDNYATLAWAVENVQPKPSELDIRAQSDSVDAEIVAEDRLDRQKDDFETKRKDRVLEAIEVLTKAVNNLQALTLLTDSTREAEIDALASSIQETRSIV